MRDSSVRSLKANHLFLFLDQKNPLCYRQCIANDVINPMLIGRAFCRLLAVGRLLHWNVCWFWLFLRDFHSWIIKYIQNAPHQKVRDKGGLWKGRFWPTPINSPHTSWKLPPLAKTSVQLDWHATVVSISGTGTTADRNGPFGVFSYGHNFFSSESELPEKMYSPLNVSIKQIGSVPENSVHSQHSRQSNKYKTEQPFLSGV